MASADEATEPLRYQIWVLKVSIHCEGCRRKVRKVLQSIEGVYTTVVDPQQHKVTVTGNVEAETLIKKLLKTGKHAELWPEKPQSNKDKAKDNNSNKSNETGGGSGNNKKANKSNGQQQQQQLLKEPKTGDESNGNEKKPSSDDSGGATRKPGTPEGEAKTPAKNNQSAKGNGKPEGKEGGGNSPLSKEKQQQQLAESKEKVSNGGGGVNEGGKKGKKGQKKENDGGEGDAAATDEPLTAKCGGPPPMQQQQQGFQFPVFLQPPVYAVSYNTAHPTTSYGYYAAPPPEALSEGCLYSAPHPAGGYYPAPPYIVLSPPRGTSFDAFSEENASYCSVM